MKKKEKTYKPFTLEQIFGAKSFFLHPSCQGKPDWMVENEKANKKIEKEYKAKMKAEREDLIKQLGGIENYNKYLIEKTQRETEMVNEIRRDRAYVERVRKFESDLGIGSMRENRCDHSIIQHCKWCE